MGPWDQMAASRRRYVRNEWVRHLGLFAAAVVVFAFMLWCAMDPNAQLTPHY